eukprot:SAG31_NODE_5513_length_2485_cov_2.063286_3_plen_130_part_00
MIGINLLPLLWPQELAEAALGDQGASVTSLLARPALQDQVRAMREARRDLSHRAETIASSVPSQIALASATLGENIQLREVAQIGSGAGLVATYVHAALCPNAGRIVCAVELGCSENDVRTASRWSEGD